MRHNNDTLATRFAAVRDRIGSAERQFGRDPGAVSLLAVSKTRSADEVRALAGLGQRRFGENYLQEGVDKVNALADLGLEWHFIGPLQSNKTRPIAERFDWVHGIDREKVAQRLNDQRPADLPPLQVCIQVNVSDEASKSGTTLEQLPALAACVAAMPRLRLRGLMAIPAPAEALEAQRRPLQRLRLALEQLCREGLPLDTLSMGMSDDLEAAVAEGATLVRIGTALFGPRPPR
jgi:pyridoxal phosphate enzyme (YggS family)